MEFEPEPLEQPEISKRSRWIAPVRRTFFELLQTVVMIVALYTVINLALPRYIVEGRSMQPVFRGEGNERVIVSRIEYFFNDPQRGDIIVLENPDDVSVYYIKRVLGLPGETVRMEDGRVYINGEAIDEPYIPDLCHSTKCTHREWVLGANEYFVLGDNRNASHDSTAFGAIDRSLIVGRAWIHYWPPEDWKLFEHFDYATH